MKLFLFIFLAVCATARGNYPVFDYRTRMRVLLIPADLRPGSVIYRLRGTDAEFDYPLKFAVVDDVGKSIIRIDNMPCNPTHTYCQANVYLAKKLEPDRVYDLILSVKDTAGRETKVDSTIKATRGTTRFEDIFPYVPNVITVPENTKVGTVLEYVLARKNPSNSHHSYLELWGSEKFRIVQNLSTKDITNGSIVLTGELDYENRSMYTLYIFCLDPYTNSAEDTRNIAGFTLPVIVQDDQDVPPQFNSLPPVTTLSDKLKVGDKILKVQAQDGDRGSPRSIRYRLVTEGNPLASFFNISEKTGEVFLAKPLDQLSKASKGQQPIILTVSAEEVKKNQWEPTAMASTTRVALLLENNYSNSPPYFQNEQYTARIAENSPQGTAIVFGEPYATVIKDDDSGKDGVFSLSLENNNGTFEISPTVGEQKANFIIRVRNNALLDFEERPYVVFSIVAKELSTPKGSSSPLLSRANVTVYLDDQNDNPPMFLQDKYEAEVPENVTAGTVITQVQATDADTGIYGKVFYTNIYGPMNQSLIIDSTTGLITVATNNHGFDRESAQEYRLMVEARDMEGVGNAATVPLIIKLLDVNDETPQFERQTFEFILQPNLRNFTSRAFVKATDNDAEKPNNIVRYEIISGNYENKFFINEITGELFIRGKLSDSTLRGTDPQGIFYGDPNGRDPNFNGDVSSSVIVLTVRAYDLGVPHRWTHAYVRIYPPEGRSRNLNFIVPGSSKDRQAIEELLRQLTGGRISIQNIRPYTGRETGTDLTEKYGSGSNDEKSVVSATVFYDGNSFVDLNQVEKRITKNKTQESFLDETVVSEYRNRNRVLFWLMMFFLILLLLILLTLILCCIWQGCCVCPLFDYDGKRVVSPSENLRFIAHERNKEIAIKNGEAHDYYSRREAWSGRNGERTMAHYDQNATRDKLVRQIKVDASDGYAAGAAATTAAAAAAAGAAAAANTFRSHGNETEHGGPNVIYTREFIRGETDRHPTMVIEDVEIKPYAMKATTIKSNLDDYQKSAHQMNVTSDKEIDSDSIRRHEVERGSDLGKAFKKSEASPRKTKSGSESFRRPHVIKEYRVVLERPEDNLSDDEMIGEDTEGSAREHYYIREGNADILRLITRGNREEEDRLKSEMKDSEEEAIKLDRGKDIIMQKFMDSSSNASKEEFHEQIIRKIRKEFEEKQTSERSYRRTIHSDTIRHLHPSGYELDTRYLGYAFQNQETQSLPGVMEISTQTERERGTQTEELVHLRPPRRKVRSDNEFSDEEDSYDPERRRREGETDADVSPSRGWIPKESKNFRGKKIIPHKMKTPILEEGETDNGKIKVDTRPAMFEIPDSEGILNGSAAGSYTENKTSILRRRKIKEKMLEEERAAAAEELSSDEDSFQPKMTARTRKSRRDYEEAKKEITDSMKELKADSLNKLYEMVQDLEETELQRMDVERKERADSLNRFYNALADFEAEAQKSLKNAPSVTSVKSDRDREDESVKTETTEKMEKMEKTTEEKTESSETEVKIIKTTIIRDSSTSRTSAKENGSEEKGEEAAGGGGGAGAGGNGGAGGSTAGDEVAGSGSIKSAKSKKSKYMDWYNDLNSRKRRPRGLKTEKKTEDDLDSGIAMQGSNKTRSGLQKSKTDRLLEKKSVFTIAYDGVKTKSIRPETNSSEKH